MESNFEVIKANFIRCEECNENFFFDFLRHPRYFVTHFKACHLKNLLYRFNGYSEEENQKIRFGPRRRKDANAWFSQLKSTEKRMISMQDNKWSEIIEKDCWSCKLCNDGKSDLTHVFELTENGKSQAFLHLRQSHENIFENVLQEYRDAADLSEIFPSWKGETTRLRKTLNLPVSRRSHEQKIAEAERSRMRRMRATPEERKMEALRSKKRRENLTPVQRQADYERRKRKKKRVGESERSRKRRDEATDEMKQKEVLRSRERRKNATEDQRKREALRSKRRRENATEEQKMKERERCRRRYEMKKQQKKSQGNNGGANLGTNLDGLYGAPNNTCYNDPNMTSYGGGNPSMMSLLMQSTTQPISQVHISRLPEREHYNNNNESGFTFV